MKIVLHCIAFVGVEADACDGATAIDVELCAYIDKDTADVERIGLAQVDKVGSHQFAPIVRRP